MAIENGKIYNLLQRNNPSISAGVESGSLLDNAKFLMSGTTDNNSQKFIIIQDTGDYYKYKNINSNKFMTLVAGETTSGSIVKQFSDIGGDNFSWKTTQLAGQTVEINGVEYDLYAILWKANESLALDYLTGATDLDKYLKVYNADDTLIGQQFALMKDSLFNSSLPAPTVSFSGYYLLPKLTTQLIEYGIRATGFNDYQIRVRKRGLIHNTNTFDGWGDWEAPDESKQDLGFGDAWNANASGDTQLQKVIVNEEPYDAYQYQMEARVFEESGGNPTHGNTTITTLLTVPQLELLDVGLTNIVIGANGIIFEFDFDYDREVGKVIEISNVYNTTKSREVYRDIKTFTLAPNQRSVILPFEELRSLPDLEDDVKVEMTYRLLDITLPTQEITREQTKKVSYDGGTLVPDIELIPINDYDYYVKINNTDITYSDISLLYNHDGNVNVGKLLKIDEFTYKLASPVGTQFRLYVYIENATEWGAKVFTFNNEHKLAIVLNTYTSEVAFKLFPNGRKDFTTQKDNGFETLKLEGKDYEKVFYSTVKGSQLTLNAIFPNTDKLNIEKALNDGFALLRTPADYYCVVAIKSINYEPINKDYTSVQLDMQEVDNEVDYSIPG